LFHHGVNDNRVPVWQTLKTAARMQDAKGEVYIRLHFDSGHGVQRTMTQIIDDYAEALAFRFRAAGLPGFR
jgi:prolyl oligopeptidase